MVGKTDLVQQPFLQFGFMFFAWSRFILHHTTTGFASITLPIVHAIATSFWFSLVLKVANLAIYAGLFWLLCWRDIQSKPELLNPILFFCLSFAIRFRGDGGTHGLSGSSIACLSLSRFGITEVGYQKTIEWVTLSAVASIVYFYSPSFFRLQTRCALRVNLWTARPRRVLVCSVVSDGNNR